MRTLTTDVTTAIEADGTAPRYLIKLSYDPVIYLSTRETVTWDGQSWTGATGAEVTSLSTSEGGSKTASISLPNHDAAYSALVLGDGIRDIAVDIYQLYGDSPFAADDAVHLFSGEIESVPAIDDYVDMSLKSSGAAVAYTPRVRLASFIGDDMPVSGTRIPWNGDVLILEAQS